MVRAGEWRPTLGFIQGEGARTITTEGDKELGERVDLAPERDPGQVAAAVNASGMPEVLPPSGRKGLGLQIAIDDQDGSALQTGSFGPPRPAAFTEGELFRRTYGTAEIVKLLHDLRELQHECPLLGFRF
jgi:hypothetical protein